MADYILSIALIIVGLGVSVVIFLAEAMRPIPITSFQLLKKMSVGFVILILGIFYFYSI